MVLRTQGEVFLVRVIIFYIKKFILKIKNKKYINF